MPTTIDYYFTPQSPWTYFGHARFTQMADAAQATVRILPVDYGQIFPASGGLPLGKRAPQRQAYRLVELARFRDALGLPMNIQPRYFPVAGDDASRLITAVDLLDGTPAAMRLSGAIFAAVWKTSWTSPAPPPWLRCWSAAASRRTAWTTGAHPRCSRLTRRQRGGLGGGCLWRAELAIRN